MMGGPCLPCLSFAKKGSRWSMKSLKDLIRVHHNLDGLGLLVPALDCIQPALSFGAQDKISLL
jgi:hypothetical protein